MTDPYGADAPTGAAPLNPPAPAPGPAPARPLTDLVGLMEGQEMHQEWGVDKPPVTADDVESWAAQLLGFANWMRRNHLP
jgi:hypothetical protein